MSRISMKHVTDLVSLHTKRASVAMATAERAKARFVATIIAAEADYLEVMKEIYGAIEATTEPVSDSGGSEEKPN